MREPSPDTTLPAPAGVASFLPVPDRILDFFIIGAPKCGTTTVYSWLESHPQTMLLGKEPNFLSRDVFDTVRIPGASRQWDTYLSRHRPPEAEAFVTGEATPRYLYSDIALSILSQHPSRPKILVLLRNPIHLVHSLHAQMVQQGDEGEVSFEKAWNRALARGPDAQGWTDRKGVIDRRLDYPMFGRIGARLEHVLRLFGPDQVKVMVLEEDIGPQPDAAYAEILEFLGLEPHSPASLERRNERVTPRSAVINRILHRMRHAVYSVGTSIGTPKPKSQRKGTGVLKLLDGMNFKRARRADIALPLDFRRELAEFFASDVDGIRKRLGRDLPSWSDWDGPKP
jgi:hypothetical protein